MSLPRRGFEPLAGGKRSATTGLLRPRPLHPGGMPEKPCCDPLGIEQRIGTLTGGIVPMKRDSTTG
ncbi:MAG: hypothetical protein MUF23_00835 [Pirellula sp.]|nr:hypothetical protein [Pirellula sp.]